MFSLSNLLLKNASKQRNIFIRGYSLDCEKLKGHSHWQNTKHEKARLASVKSKVFSDFSREIIRAVREGGSDPHTNNKLASLIARAGRISYTKDKIQESISVALRKNKDGPSHDVYLNGHSNLGFNLLIWGKSSAKEFFLNEAKRIFKRNNVIPDTTGSMKYNFEEKYIIRVSNLHDVNDPEPRLVYTNQNQIYFIKNELGADYACLKDHPEYGPILELVVSYAEGENVMSLIRNLNIFPHANSDDLISMDNDYVARELSTIPDDLLEKAEMIIDSLYELNDIVRVFDNIKNLETSTIKID